MSTTAAAAANLLVRVSHVDQALICGAKLSSAGREFILHKRGLRDGARNQCPVEFTGAARAAGGTGRRARLRGVWGNPSGFESRVAHHLTVSARKPPIDSPTSVVSARKPANRLYRRRCGMATNAQVFGLWHPALSLQRTSSSQLLTACRMLSSRVARPVGCTVSTYRRSIRWSSQSQTLISRIAPVFRSEGR